MSSALPPEVPNAQRNIAQFHIAEASRGLDALSGLYRIRNTPFPEMDKDLLAQRKTLLDVAIRVLENDLFKMLDAACVEWCQVRKLKV